MKETGVTDTSAREAILLLGPTGSGKTPLGELIEEQGLWGRPCVHFDFGANLRRVVMRDRPDEMISRPDLDFLKEVLRSGALLENEHFPIAERLLRSFLVERDPQARRLVVLNGLPRHVGQAEAIDAILSIRGVICLDCSAETVLERISANVGGDRTGRPDDHPGSIRRKLRVFGARTAPLVEHYRDRGARIERLEIAAGMTAAEMWQLLQSCER
jgi:adenylate kinase